ncbi:Aldo kereductase [Rhizoctonia solani]|uniref:Aldo kereductase n=1 Tax=Rhizoctonia solani TaxID=456999 RepID=A0A8H7ID14_9AGAM|nr:Aldo kereductase [Rhizoctonia solani]KAF8752865.1 Aldo kereductase [Rhizoctonia solani]
MSLGFQAWLSVCGYYNALRIAAHYAQCIRHIDSAQMYRNENAVGQAVKESGLKREEIFITTKCASRSHGYEKTLAGVDESLSKFGFEYIDLFLIHDPLSGPVKRMEAYKALLECRDKGKIKSIGVSNYGVKHLEEIKQAGLEAPTVNQIELHPWCQQKEIVEYCEKNDIVVQAYCPIVRGEKWGHPALVELSKKHGRSEAQILIRWSLQKGYVPLPKSTHEERIVENAEVFGFELGSEDMGILDALDEGSQGAISWNPVNAA